MLPLKAPSFFTAFCHLLPTALQALGCNVSSPFDLTLSHEKAERWATAVASSILSKEPLLRSNDLSWSVSPDRYGQLQFYGQDATSQRGVHSFVIRLFQRQTVLTHDLWSLEQQGLPFDPELSSFFEQAIPLVRKEWTHEVVQQRFHWHDVSPALLWRWKSVLLAPWQRTLEQDSLTAHALFDRCLGKQDSYWIMSHGSDSIAIEPIQRTGRLGFDGTSLPEISARPSHLTELVEIDCDLVLDVPYNAHVFLRGHVLPAVHTQGALAVRIDWRPLLKTPNFVALSQN
jgi:hypothetical protein